jgi:hypothetical protein
LITAAMAAESAVPHHFDFLIVPTMPQASPIN